MPVSLGSASGGLVPGAAAGEGEPALRYRRRGRVGGWAPSELPVGPVAGSVRSGASCAGSEVCAGERCPLCPQPLPGCRKSCRRWDAGWRGGFELVLLHRVGRSVRERSQVSVRATSALDAIGGKDMADVRTRRW